MKVFTASHILDYVIDNCYQYYLFLMASQPDFHEAVARARQVAEKMQMQKRSLPGGEEDNGMKRSKPDMMGSGNSPNSFSDNSSQGPVDPLERVKMASLLSFSRLFMILNFNRLLQS